MPPPQIPTRTSSPLARSPSGQNTFDAQKKWRFTPQVATKHHLVKRKRAKFKAGPHRARYAMRISLALYCLFTFQ